MAESQEATNRRLFHITTLSPRARSVISDEMYYVDTEKDSVDNETVQQEAFLCLTEDMGEIGVYWATSNADIYASTYTLDQALAALDYIMPNTLYIKMRDDENIVKCFRSLLHGDISDTDPIISYLDFLGGDDERAAYKLDLAPAFLFLKENIRSTEVFTDYLGSLLSKYDSERTSKTLLLTSPKEYHQFITTMINRCYDATVALRSASLIDDQQQDKLNKRISLTQKYFLQSDNIEAFSFVVLTDPNTLATDGLSTYNVYKTSMFAGCRMALEYRISRQTSLTYLDVCANCIFLYSITVNKSDYDRMIADLCAEHQDIAADVRAMSAVLTALYDKGE